MKSLVDQHNNIVETNFNNGSVNDTAKEVSALYDVVAKVFGTEKFNRRVSKLAAEELLESEKIEDRIAALHRIVFNSKELPTVSKEEYIDGTLKDIENKIGEILARKVVENRIEKEMMDKVDEKQKQYMEEMKLQIISKNVGHENPYTLKKYAALEKLETVKLAKSTTELFRPKKLEEVQGQELPIKSLVSKIASPFPQHIIIYGPPGVGKTTAARLALEYAKKMKHTPFRDDARFIEVDGTTLRWDPREITNPLLGSVHDPIYQGSKKDLAEVGIPEPKPGLVTEAHGGILFIDEIGELDIFLQNKLLKVLEDKRVEFDSAYYDPDNPSTPLYVKKLFEEGAPADFVLIGATTRQPHEINPALRSRCGEVFFEPLASADIINIVRDGAYRLNVELDSEVPKIISHHTIEGRKAISILGDAYSIALYEQLNTDKPKITKENIYNVIQMSRLTPNARKKASDTPEVGKVFGLGVSGFMGSIIEMECISFEALEKGKGSLRFNDTVGSMTKDSIFNAASVIRRVTGRNLSDYDVHVNAIGGGNIDGPSAGLAITLAMLSAIENKKVLQDVALTGEISIQGKIKPVGGINEKIYGARQSGMKKVILPKDNQNDVCTKFDDLEVLYAESIQEVLDTMLV